MKKPDLSELLLGKVKANLILEHDQDDDLLLGFIRAAISYAESFQHLSAGTYLNRQPSTVNRQSRQLPPTTEQAILMLSSHFYESRDGSTAGFFGDNVQAGRQVYDTCNLLLRLDRDWGCAL
jgi:hypothetical protein